MFFVFLTFDQFRTNMASVSRETKRLFFLRLLIASIPACTGLPGGQSSVSSPFLHSSSSSSSSVFIHLKIRPTVVHFSPLCCNLLRFAVNIKTLTFTSHK